MNVFQTCCVQEKYNGDQTCQFSNGENRISKSRWNGEETLLRALVYDDYDSTVLIYVIITCTSRQARLTTEFSTGCERLVSSKIH